MIVKIAKRIRHLKVFKNAEWFWNMLRKPYQFLLDPFHLGVNVHVADLLHAKIPADMTGCCDWGQYEKEAVQCLYDWIKDKKNPLVLDVGSSIGLFSLITLAARKDSELIAFESDIQSIQIARHLTKYYQEKRQQFVHGLISDKSKTGQNIKSAIKKTKQSLKKQTNHKIKNPHFICLEDSEARQLPQNSLDSLFAGTDLKKRKILIKIDVEGAELLVLRGARAFLKQYRPAMLISAHPNALPRYGQTLAQLKKEIRNHGYRARIVSQDHEIHLFCHSLKNN